MFLRLLFLAVLLGSVSCANKTVVQEPAPETAKRDQPAPTHTSIEISYVRGNNQHRFVAHDIERQAIAKCYVDKQLLRETSIDLMKYQDLFKRTSELISSVQHHNFSQETPCRTPFTVSLKTQSAIQEVNGCRSTDEGASLGKLIRDAEFLVFSSNKN
jgi:hypothetical protein